MIGIVSRLPNKYHRGMSKVLYGMIRSMMVHHGIAVNNEIGRDFDFGFRTLNFSSTKVFNWLRFMGLRRDYRFTVFLFSSLHLVFLVLHSLRGLSVVIRMTSLVTVTGSEQSPYLFITTIVTWHSIFAIFSELFFLTKLSKWSLRHGEKGQFRNSSKISSLFCHSGQSRDPQVVSILFGSKVLKYSILRNLLKNYFLHFYYADKCYSALEKVFYPGTLLYPISPSSNTVVCWDIRHKEGLGIY